MNFEEATELMVLFKNSPLAVTHAEARWDAVDDIVIDVEAIGGGTITVTDIETGRRLAGYMAQHDTHARMRCASYNPDDNTVTQCSPEEWRGNASGRERSIQESDCSSTVKAIRSFTGMTLEYDGPPKFWHVSFIDPKTDTQYPVNMSFETMELADQFIKRYTEEGCPSFESQEFLALKSKYA